MGEYQRGRGGASEAPGQSLPASLDRGSWPCLHVIGVLRVRFLGAVGRVGPMAENIIWYRRVIYPHSGGGLGGFYARRADNYFVGCALQPKSLDRR